MSLRVAVSVFLPVIIIGYLRDWVGISLVCEVNDAMSKSRR